MGTTVDTQNVVNRGHDPNRRSGATPLQRRLNEVGEVLALAALAIVGVVFALGLLRGEDLEIMFLTAVRLAVAAVPEGLPAVVTISLGPALLVCES